MNRLPLRLRLLVLVLFWDMLVMSRLERILNWLESWDFTRPKVERFLMGAIVISMVTGTWSTHIPVWSRVLIILICGPLTLLSLIPQHLLTFERRFIRRWTVHIALSRIVFQLFFLSMTAIQCGVGNIDLGLGYIVWLLFILVIDCVSHEPPKKKRSLADLKKLFNIDWIPDPLEGAA